MVMQKRLTKKERFFNNITLTADDEVYVGIDVHKIKYHVAIWLNNGIALTFVTPSDNLAIANTLSKLTPALKQIVYEAGPTGHNLWLREPFGGIGNLLLGFVDIIIDFISNLSNIFIWKT